jgi:hypothetical protein
VILSERGAHVGEKNMRVLFTWTCVLVLASITAANAEYGSNGFGRGSLVNVCRPQCGVKMGFYVQVTAPERACVAKCIAAKKAAQH